jgi:hypothetical protein
MRLDLIERDLDYGSVSATAPRTFRGRSNLGIGQPGHVAEHGEQINVRLALSHLR